MTVSELIQRLNRCPSEATVNVRDNDLQCHEANIFEICYNDIEDTIDVIIDFVE